MAFAPASAVAQALPFIDASFTRRSADNDPDLIVVRERFDPATRTQSIYLRVNDASEDLQYFSGRLLVRGASVAAIISGAQQMAGTDESYGLPGVDYTPNAARRALDGPDPATQVPMRNSGQDAVRVESPTQARFWLGTTDDIDDLRIVLRYPPEPGPASFDVELFHAQRPDPAGWPTTTQGGIQIGSLVDAVPDDGDYSEVFEVRNVKLRIEDLDLRERDVVVGSISEAGGRVGPAQVQVENFAAGVDLDQDNGFDQNGLISPIPAGSDLEHLSWLVEPLSSVNGDPAFVPSDAIELIGAPPRLAVGEAVAVLVAVDVPAGLPLGPYAGRLIVWEDNDLDRRHDPFEPADTLALSVVVVRDGDAQLDFERPPLDLGFPPDDATPDAVSTDAGEDASSDGATPTDGVVAGDGVVASDGATPTDGVVPSDGVTPTDGVVASDGATPTDGVVASDGATPTDGVVPSDGATPTDGVVPSDGVTPTDGVVPSDGATPTDGVVARDGDTPTDGDAPGDVRPEADAGRRDFGTPGGGAFACAFGPHPAQTGWTVAFALTVALAVRARRRR